MRVLFLNRTVQVEQQRYFGCSRSAAIWLLLAMLCFPACKNDPKELPNLEEMRAMQNDHARDVKFIFSKDGRVKATLRSDTFIQNNQAKPPYIDLKNDLKLVSYDSLLQVESTVTAEFARYFPQTGNIIVRNKVVVVNQKGEKLETEELIWNQKLQRFYTDKFVRITMDGQITYGEGLEANQDFTWFRIKHQKGTIPVEKSSLPPMS